jgi:hypothetical protein
MKKVNRVLNIPRLEYTSTVDGALTAPEGLTMSVIFSRAAQVLIGGMQDAFTELRGAMVVQS